MISPEKQSMKRLCMEHCLYQFPHRFAMQMTRCLHMSFGRPKRKSMSTMHLFSGTIIGPTVQLASAHIAGSWGSTERGGASCGPRCVASESLLTSHLRQTVLKPTNRSSSSKEVGHERFTNGKGMHFVGSRSSLASHLYQKILDGYCSLIHCRNCKS
jgi:hypothetical protein